MFDVNAWFKKLHGWNALLKQYRVEEAMTYLEEWHYESRHSSTEEQLPRKEKI